MKQSFTLESDLAMIIDLLTEMVENENISEKQSEMIIKKIFQKMDSNQPEEKPTESVVKNILNYSKALQVLHPGKPNPIGLIIN